MKEFNVSKIISYVRRTQQEGGWKKKDKRTAREVLLEIIYELKQNSSEQKNRQWFEVITSIVKMNEKGHILQATTWRTY